MAAANQAMIRIQRVAWATTSKEKYALCFFYSNASNTRTKPERRPNPCLQFFSLTTVAMAASLRNLLSFSPSLPLPAKKEPSFSPPPPATTNLPWRRLSRSAECGFLPALRSPAEAAPGSEGVLRSCFPSLAWANVMFAKGGHYNVQVVVGEDEPEEMLLRRFRREVIEAGVVQECRRRRWFENTREKRKRKAREATRWTQKRRFQPKSPPKDKKEAPIKEKEEGEDNWELPEGELPY